MKHRIEVGSVFASVSAWGSRWKVTEIIEKPGYPDHVRIQSLTEPGDHRLLAVAALLDRSKFVPESGQQDGAAAPGPESGEDDLPPRER